MMTRLRGWWHRLFGCVQRCEPEMPVFPSHGDGTLFFLREQRRDALAATKRLRTGSPPTDMIRGVWPKPPDEGRPR